MSISAMSFILKCHVSFAEGTSDVIPGAAVKKDEKPREFILKMWQNGFSIDDGPLRAYNDQQNREFLNDVMMGRIPRELVREARGGEVMVNMEDHKDQQFEPSKVRFFTARSDCNLPCFDQLHAHI